jgi:hypothetical protein
VNGRGFVVGRHDDAEYGHRAQKYGLQPTFMS